MSRSSSRTLSGSFGRLGAGPKQGIAPDAIMNVNLGRPNQAWTDDGWTNTDDPAEGSTWCCYVVGDTTTCHQH
jgi:hypothetical protein